MTALRWLTPHFTQWQCATGAMPEHERLGLPDYFVETDLQLALAAATAALRRADTASLLARVEDAAVPLAERIAAGNLLALAGDPRIDPLAPAMVTIAGGPVAIGLPAAQVAEVVGRLAHLGLDAGWIAKESPRHGLELAPYALARYPVTNAEYRQFLSETGFPELPTGWACRRYPAEKANHPVCTVSPEAADAYARWLSVRTGRPFRLPSEAEWEYAAAGPEGREYPWGEAFAPEHANTAECGLFDTAPVGAFASGLSPFGLADMGGNVEEYVADAYAPYPGGAPVDDHLAQIHGQYRVARGGCFSRFADLARTRRRHGHNPRSPAYAMGFRLALSL